MTSEQVMLTVTALLLCGCAPRGPQAETAPQPPVPQRLWAVAPLRNESGSAYADGLALADHLAQQLETAPGVDVLPVNRTLRALESLHMGAPESPQDALKLLGTLEADALVVGTITAYDPYEPPKLGLALELYVAPRRHARDPVALRQLVSAAVDRSGDATQRRRLQPVCVASAVFDARDPAIDELLGPYLHGSGSESDTAEAARLHRLSMDLFSQFVSHVMSRRLLRAESSRRAAAQSARVPDR